MQHREGVLWVALVMGSVGVACGGTTNGGTATGAGGSSGDGSGGSITTSTGGATSDGANAGGAASAGATSGGANAGGAASAGASSGGANAGGSSTGGATSAGGSSGGVNAGGTSSGGSSGSGGSKGGGWWKPAKDTTFYWDLQNAPPDNSRNVGAYDIDGWGNTAEEVTALHAKGIKVVCYMDAGTYEPGRPDSANFPAGLKGAAVEGWPGELWLDVRPTGPDYAKLQAIMQARFETCQQKGFDAVEPDNLDSYENSPGFNTSGADQLAYNEWLATTVHGLGLAILQKNDLDQIKTLEPYFDGALDEECNRYSECNTLAPYTAAGKPVWNAEYQEDKETTAKFCDADIAANIVGALFGRDLDGKVFQPCSNDVGLEN